MERTRLSTKGQVIIPKSLRDAKGWHAGMPLEVEEMGDSLVLRPLRSFPRTELEQVLGCLDYRGPARTLQEMDEAIADAARRVP